MSDCSFILEYMGDKERGSSNAGAPQYIFVVIISLRPIIGAHFIGDELKSAWLTDSWLKDPKVHCWSYIHWRGGSGGGGQVKTSPRLYGSLGSVEPSTGLGSQLFNRKSFLSRFTVLDGSAKARMVRWSWYGLADSDKGGPSSRK